MERGLGLFGAPNTRDLGGLPTIDGRRVRRGRVVRASALGRLTDDDVAVLGALRLARVVDLRDVSEVALAPPDRLPTDPAPAVTTLPIYDPAHPVFTYVSAVMLGHQLDGYEALAEEGTPGAMTAIYRWFVTGESARDSLAAAVRVLADPVALPVLVHCSAGKDRTGWLSAIVLTALGVDRVEITVDYLATNHAAAEVNGAILAAMRERRPELDEDAIRPVLEARTDYLDAAYAEVDRVYGGFDAYLREGLGMDEALCQALRANLLE
ncbi:MAG TPA: tyrosine-protein phosphatase [Micromonosporaceae bacterium]|nr:tyrosine-protein phosphatase [Micromonosporaceae bacterium]